jgi:predicted nucleic acid-binding protein
MNIVVADASPINYLVLIGEIDILSKLYSHIMIPNVVVEELLDPSAPTAVAAWTRNLPEWITVSDVASTLEQKPDEIDAGEWSAIMLAASMSVPTLLLIDDARGRLEAERRHIAVTGTLGILRAGAIRKFVDLPAALRRLKETNFRCSQTLIDNLLAEDYS